MSEDLEDRLNELRQQFLDHLLRIENVTSEPADRADTTPNRAPVEHPRPVTTLRHDVMALIDDLHNEIRLLRSERRAAGLDRWASAQDRHASARDRWASAQDRDAAARDRHQATIDRERTESHHLRLGDHVPSKPGDLGVRLAQVVSDSNRYLEVTRAKLAQAMSDSRQHIAASRAKLAQSRHPTSSPPASE